MVRPRVLLVESEFERARDLALGWDASFDHRHVPTAAEAMRLLPGAGWDAVVARHDLEDGSSGLELLQVARDLLPPAFRLLYCAARRPGLAGEACRLAHVHFAADGGVADLPGALRDALRDLFAPVEPEPVQVPTEPWASRAPVGREFLRQLRAAAESSVPVYLHGERGTGRARAARMLREWRGEWLGRGAPGAEPGPRPACVLRVPALRERPQDLPLIAACCLLEQAMREERPLRRLSPEALDALRGREWRGNVAELASALRCAVERAGPRERVEPADLPGDAWPALRPSLRAKDDGQRECVLRQLRTARTVSGASRLEGCTRANYIRMMRRLGVLRADVAAATEPAETAGPSRPPVRAALAAGPARRGNAEQVPHGP
jgi:DNA-binding NtrC family response regulator